MSIPTIKELRRRVKLGAHLLDKEQPLWHREVVLPELNMEDNYACILGQTGGNYWDYVAALGIASGDGLDDGKAIRRGFSLYDNEASSPRSWSRLTELWAVEVALRQVRDR